MVRVQRGESRTGQTYLRFPTALGEARVACNEKQLTLAAALGLNRTYIAMIEAGFCLPSLGLFEELTKRYLGTRLYPEWVENIINGVAENGA